MRAVVVGVILLCLVSGCTKTPKTVTNTIGMELIEIPAGKFTMGIPASEKDITDFEHRTLGLNDDQAEVTLTKPFRLGKTEVTQGQWTQVMGTEPWKGQDDNVQADKDCPASYVSWDDAREFCETLTDLERKAGKLKANEEYRLPTEAEWEYACRAGTTTKYSFGDDEKQRDEYIVVGSSPSSPLAARKVGTKKPNPWGLYDMHGNVQEWCSDWYGWGSPGSPAGFIKYQPQTVLPGGTDPVGPKRGSFRVTRGGHFVFPQYVHSGHRFARQPPSDLSQFTGFRVARSQSAP